MTDIGQKGPIMLLHHVKTAMRNILRHKLFAVINISGLALGLAASILILLFVRFEMSYEDWLPGAENIYRMDVQWLDREKGGINGQSEWSPGPLKAALERDFGEIQNATRTAFRRVNMHRGSDVFSEIIIRADGNFFDVFKLPFVAGDPAGAIGDTSSIVMSETAAKKYFGDRNPVGETLVVNKDEAFRVTGVIEDLPRSTQLEFNMITLFDLGQIKGSHYYDDWGSTTLITYFTLRPGASIDSILARLGDFLVRNVPPADANRTSFVNDTGLVPVALSDAHLMGRSGDDYMPGGGLRTVVTFTVVAFLILGIAIFNFVNSSTAAASLRAKEVAVRKVMGAHRAQLVRQFMGETVIIAMIALLLALALVELAMPWFRTFVDKPIEAAYLGDPALLLGLIVLGVFVGIGSGFYPALFLSRYRPARTLASGRGGAAGSPRLRTVLVLAQFAISIGLMIVAGVVYMQFRYASTMELGFDRDNKILLTGVGRQAVQDHIDTLKFELRAIPGVTGLTQSYVIPGDGTLSTRNTFARQLGDDFKLLRINPVDFGFFDIYGVAFLAGRALSPDHAGDTLRLPDNGDNESVTPANAIINQTTLAALELGTPEEAIGKTFKVFLDYGDGYAEMTVVGVVAEFKERSIRESVLPSVYYNRPDKHYTMTVALEPGAAPGVLDDIDTAWKGVFPEQPIHRSFLDLRLRELYKGAETRAKMLFAFSALAIVISCLGLYGLASFAAARRTREVGIRKIMGASVPDIVRLMVVQFSVPVLIANLVAWPVAWYFAHEWLRDFEYRIDIGPELFVGAGLAALVFAWITVGGHAYRSARTSPAQILRYE